ncbi:MAG TPA: hypothetical protein VKE40_28320 [Gemmataceae bacterium]|nr:hypothetical protein [Gemmataceae bacterium]
MRHRRRLERLTERARAIESKRARSVRAKLCVGLDWDQILLQIAQAVRPEHVPIMEAIGSQLQDYSDRTPQRPGFPDRHGFLDWIFGLQDGRWSLSEQLPEAWLTAWRDGYRKEWGFDKRPWSPRPFNRCEDCRLALPNVGPDGRFEGPGFPACPACGGQRISQICFYDMRKFSLDGGRTDFF